MIDTQAYKDRLISEKATLEAELATVGRRNPSNPNDWEAIAPEGGEQADPNDTAEILEVYGENAAILNDLEIRYNQVKDALSRIEAGTYGTCSVSGEEIEEERLNADPAAATCIAHIESK